MTALTACLHTDNRQVPSGDRHGMQGFLNAHIVHTLQPPSFQYTMPSSDMLAAWLWGGRLIMKLRQSLLFDQWLLFDWVVAMHGHCNPGMQRLL